MDEQFKQIYKDFQIDEAVLNYCSDVETSLKKRFEAIDRTAEYNQMKVLKAMQSA